MNDSFKAGRLFSGWLNSEETKTLPQTKVIVFEFYFDYTTIYSLYRSSGIDFDKDHLIETAFKFSKNKQEFSLSMERLKHDIAEELVNKVKNNTLLKIYKEHVKFFKLIYDLLDYYDCYSNDQLIYNYTFSKNLNPTTVILFSKNFDYEL